MDFSSTQIIVISGIFVWSGFVRAGLGFGGAALALPLMLLVADKPLFFLPIIATHLLIFLVSPQACASNTSTMGF